MVKSIDEKWWNKGSFMAQSFFSTPPLGGSLNGSEISHRWSVWEMEHNYCRSVSTNGWLVGNSVMTECAQVGCNRVLNEWCRPRTHPSQCRCRLQQLPSGRLRHRDRVFSTRGTKIIIIKKKSHVHKTTKNPHHFECSHDSLSSWKAKERSRVLDRWVRSDLVLLEGAFVWILPAFTPPVALSRLGYVCDPPLDASLNPSWRFPRLQVVCAERSQIGTDGRQPSASTVYPKKNTMFQSQILPLQPLHPMSLLDTHQLSEDCRIASRLQIFDPRLIVGLFAVWPPRGEHTWCLINLHKLTHYYLD